MHVGNGIETGKDTIPFYNKTTSKKLQGWFGDKEKVRPRSRLMMESNGTSCGILEGNAAQGTDLS